LFLVYPFFIGLPFLAAKLH